MWNGGNMQRPDPDCKFDAFAIVEEDQDLQNQKKREPSESSHQRKILDSFEWGFHDTSGTENVVAQDGDSMKENVGFPTQQREPKYAKDKKNNVDIHHRSAMGFSSESDTESDDHDAFDDQDAFDDNDIDSKALWERSGAGVPYQESSKCWTILNGSIYGETELLTVPTNDVP